tara:strand:+ start:210502 stop:211185 length:684 start_codon:yes stop_codon:yes gene_type:complete
MSSLYRNRDYLEYWGLDTPPFVQRDPNRFFSGSAQRDVLAEIENFVASGNRLAILVSAPGCGATRIFEHLSLLSGIGDQAVEIALAPAIPTASESLRSVWLIDARRNRDSIRDAASRSNTSVVIRADYESRANIIREVGQIPTVIELAHMPKSDAPSYVDYAVRMAGGKKQIFTESAIFRLHELSAGCIRNFSRMAENALWKSWVCQATKVGPNMVQPISVTSREAA